MKRRTRQHGFTLIEVMVSLVISAVLVGMVLALFSRMTLAYRGQQNVAELQQILAAGQSLIERDLRLAGHQVPDGFFIANDTKLHQPVEVLNDADGFGPDELHVFYADGNAQARVESFDSTVAGNAFEFINVDDAGDFVPGDVVVIVKGQKGTIPKDTRFYSCVVQIETIPNSTRINLDGAGRWGTPDNDQCDEVRGTTVVDTFAMVFRFRARGYRIDPNRRDLAVLQMSPTAGYDDDWQDLAVGFTDLQVASRWNDSLDPAAKLLDSLDLDNDLTHEWYSDATQNILSQPLDTISGLPGDAYQVDKYPRLRPLMVALRVSLVVRTTNRVDGVPSQRTPKLVDDARPGNNDLGDRSSIQLDGVADLARPEELRGNRIYRYATVGTDLRNLGIGL